MSDTTTQLLETLAQVLLRCLACGVLALLVWLGFYTLLGDLLYQLHGNLFGLSRHEVDLIHYCGMGLLKLSVFVCFVFPWLAIKLVLRNSR